MCAIALVLALSVRGGRAPAVGAAGPPSCSSRRPHPVRLAEWPGARRREPRPPARAALPARSARIAGLGLAAARGARAAALLIFAGSRGTLGGRLARLVRRVPIRRSRASRRARSCGGRRCASLPSASDRGRGDGRLHVAVAGPPPGAGPSAEASGQPGQRLLPGARGDGSRRPRLHARLRRGDRAGRDPACGRKRPGGTAASPTARRSPRSRFSIALTVGSHWLGSGHRVSSSSSRASVAAPSAGRAPPMGPADGAGDAAVASSTRIAALVAAVAPRARKRPFDTPRGSASTLRRRPRAANSSGRAGASPSGSRRARNRASRSRTSRPSDAPSRSRRRRCDRRDLCGPPRSRRRPCLCLPTRRRAPCRRS